MTNVLLAFVGKGKGNSLVVIVPFKRASDVDNVSMSWRPHAAAIHNNTPNASKNKPEEGVSKNLINL